MVHVVYSDLTTQSTIYYCLYFVFLFRSNSNLARLYLSGI